MGILGKIIKAAAQLNPNISADQNDMIEDQKKVLLDLLSDAQNTAFGKFHGFPEILRKENIYENFKNEVPIHSYEEIKFWWEKQQRFPDITWRGKPKYFALTSGTTGSESKKIPVTNDFSSSMRSVGIALTSELAKFSVPEEIFESEVLMLSSSSDLKKTEQGFFEGEISGINVSNFPDWYDYFYRPGKEIASLNDWDLRLKKIVEKAPEWNIGCVAGIPSWVLRMLQAIKKEYNLEYIQDIWPNFRMFVSGGVAYETYRKDFDDISKNELIIIDTYLASEGFFAYTADPKKMSMKLATNHGYFFEFIPFDERGIDNNGEIRKDPKIFTLDQVNLSDEYVLVVSTNAGAWRYVIGDTIKFTSLDPFEIKITGRTKFFLNVFGSQLSEEKLDNAILSCSEKLNVSINEYMVSAQKRDEDTHLHKWVIVSDEKFNEDNCAEIIDDHLKKQNNNYRVARNKTIDQVVVIRVTRNQYDTFIEENSKKGGQVKIQKLMEDEEMEDFLSFINA
ncbi:MAG: GH3 auxin-responsive promoter family protein [Brumimicrobium sp.]|nr:GH3 auxin-responsive promoter family protein [Brumimicrobium sp.]